ncbi:class I SAM-dependent methyltransferase [Actinoallomurus sp. CA-150999]|uniref:class I SAM-dependent methyltransferase n=1 Tax=Actinoallomurus sp. CA-150999 TaxID=3239887 RepID=UPI003D91AB82
MKTRSLWQDTKTFFPLFSAELERRRVKTVCVVGASDGKFVIPLAEHGYRVLAIERDPQAVHGGPVTLPGHVPGDMLGLRRRLDIERVAANVDIIEADLLEQDVLPTCDAVWTSCSWHYSVNHRRPLADFIGRLHALCAPTGILGAEYMMPVRTRHTTIEHYLEKGEIRRYFERWRLLWEAYTPTFVEDPHVEKLKPHIHRMGFVVAERA